MTITGFYARQKKTHINRKINSLIRFCGTAYIAVNTFSPTPALASNGGNIETISKAALATFAPGGPGAVIISLMLIAVVGWLCSYIASAVGHGNIAGMIKVSTVFSCIALVAETAFNALGSISKFLG